MVMMGKYLDFYTIYGLWGGRSTFDPPTNGNNPTSSYYRETFYLMQQLAWKHTDTLADHNAHNGGFFKILIACVGY